MRTRLPMRSRSRKIGANGVKTPLAFLILSPLLLALTAGGEAQKPPAEPEPAPRHILTIQKNRLSLGDIPFRNIGANLPDLFERFLHNEDAGAIASLTRAKETGVRFVRCFGTTWGSAEFGIFETDRARWLDAFDRMLAAADSQGMTVVPSLLFNIQMLPEYIRKKTGRDEQVVEYLTPGSASNTLAVAYVTAIVSRYREDPRILLWEIGNEYNLEADLSAQWKRRPPNQIPTSDHVIAFLAQIATVIKGLDKKHLVTSGNADMRPSAWNLRQAMLAHRSAPDPADYPMDWTKDTFHQYTQMLQLYHPAPIDVISVHQYPPGKETPRWMVENDDYAFLLPWTQIACDRIGKPLFVGEVGQKVYQDGKELEGRWILDFLKRIVLRQAQVAAFWSWEYDPDNPDQSPYSLSATRTPNLVTTLKNANTTIQIEQALLEAEGRKTRRRR